MRKIEMLKITRFEGIPSAELVFNKPVSLFVGRNNQGKSSIIDALTFAFTGKCRSISKFKDTGALSHGGQKGMQVHVNYKDKDGELCVIKRSTSNASKNLDPNPIIPYCLDSQAFLKLSAPERGKILASVLGEGLNELIKEAIATHIGDFPEPIRAEIKAAGVNIYDVDALRDEVVMIRRGYKREANELDLLEPTLTSYQLPENYAVDKDEKELASITAHINQAERDIAIVKERLQIQANIHDIGKAIKEHEADIRPEPRIGVMDEADKVATSELIVQLANLIGKKHDNLNDIIQCPTCEQDVEVNELLAVAGTRKQWLTKFKTAIEERNAIVKKNAGLQRQVDGLKEYLKKLEADLAELPELDGPKIEKELSSLRAQQSVLNDNIEHYRQFQNQAMQVKINQKKHNEFAELVKQCDRIDDALKDGGPVKSAIAAGGRELPINQKLLDVWGMTGLTWQNNGEILYNGRPIEQASRSEQYRASSVMALALSKIGNVGICSLDEFETLVGDNANQFFDVVNECGLNNVFVCASSVADYTVVEIPKWLEVFTVNKGVIKRI